MLCSSGIKFSEVSNAWGLQQDPSCPGAVAYWPVVRIL